jgi:hypothetical protein
MSHQGVVTVVVEDKRRVHYGISILCGNNMPHGAKRKDAAKGFFVG